MPALCKKIVWRKASTAAVAGRNPSLFEMARYGERAAVPGGVIVDLKQEAKEEIEGMLGES